MTDTEFDSALVIAVKARDARNTVKGFWGAGYEERAKPWRALIRQGVANAKCSPLEIPVIMQRNARAQGNDIEDMPLLMLIAASVDVAEEGRAR